MQFFLGKLANGEDIVCIEIYFTKKLENVITYHSTSNQNMHLLAIKKDNVHISYQGHSV
jgi:hypothetical protein